MKGGNKQLQEGEKGHKKIGIMSYTLKMSHRSQGGTRKYPIMVCLMGGEGARKGEFLPHDAQFAGRA